MKKFFLLTLFSLLLPIVANAKPVEIVGIYYNFIGNEAEVTYKKMYKSSYSGTVVIPESVIYKEKTYRVTSIGEMAFWGCSDLTSISIPNSVTSIGKSAFRGCSSLRFIKVETGNATYDSRNDCNAIIETATNTLIIGCQNTVIPNSVIRIGEYAFSPCSTFSIFTDSDSKKSITIPNGVVSIGKGAFECYSGLTSVTIPESVTTIGDNAFWACDDLTSVTILGNVINMGEEIFASCDNLQSVTVSSSAISDLKKFEFSSDVAIIVAKNSDIASAPAINNAEASTPNPAIKPEPTTTPNTPTTPQPKADVDMDIPSNPTVNEKTFAVIFANEKYQEEADVEYAENDGEIFEEYCHKVLGIPEENIHLRKNATRNNMVAEISWMKKVAESYNEQAKFIVFYAGHGMPDEKTKSAYLLPVDGIETEPETAYSLDQLYETLGKLPAAGVTIFLDACFSGSQRGEGMLASARFVAFKPKDSAPQGKMVVFSAATGDETAYPYKEKGHGLFTYYLLKKLKETKGNVTYGELSTYLQTEVKRKSIVANRKSQTPTIVPSQFLTDNWQTLKLK